MVRIGLQAGSGEEFIAVKVKGMPIGRYAAQIRQLLTEYGLEGISRYFAQPVFSSHADKAQWFYDTRFETLTPWQEASTAQKLSGLQQLIAMTDAIERLRLALPKQAKRSLSFIDQILKNLTLIPSIETIFLVNQQPVLLYWGYYGADQRTVDFRQCYDSLSETQAVPSPPVSVPQPSAQHRRCHKIALRNGLLAVILAATAWGFYHQSVFTIPRQDDSKEVAQIAKSDDMAVIMQNLTTITHNLPVQPAKYQAPAPQLAEVKAKKTKQALMIPTAARYQGSTSFLDGIWYAEVQENNHTTRFTFDFRHGKAKTTLRSGSQHCVTQSHASFSSAGQLAIVTARSTCQGQLTLPATTILCEKSQPNTECQWKKNASSSLPVTLYREGT
ncbi:hypothetical protein [Rosenbergiella australiborealis]|uniref:hypothetical protein n=1 Tax=Rosenbergiella australiborealis TaxID=1544696 RepID=UPI001F4E0281|nr:hypothetical protein [Rosenbergiella australiborealis]